MKYGRSRPNQWYTRAFGHLFGDSNARADLRVARRQLERLGVEFTEVPLRGGGAWIVFPETQLRKLPSWDRKRFIPMEDDDSSGFSIWNVTVFQIASLNATRRDLAREKARRARLRRRGIGRRP